MAGRGEGVHVVNTELELERNLPTTSAAHEKFKIPASLLSSIRSSHDHVPATVNTGLRA